MREEGNVSALIWISYPRVSVSLADVKDLAYKLVNEIEESDKKIIYLKNVQRQLRVSYYEFLQFF